MCNAQAAFYRIYLNQTSEHLWIIFYFLKLAALQMKVQFKESHIKLSNCSCKVSYDFTNWKQ